MADLDGTGLTRAERRRAGLNHAISTLNDQLRREDERTLAKLLEDRASRVDAGVATHGEFVSEFVARGMTKESATKAADAAIAHQQERSRGR